MSYLLINQIENRSQLLFTSSTQEELSPSFNQSPISYQIKNQNMPYLLINQIENRFQLLFT
jgi:hypothetical protein